jgi:hypothetical protein
MRENTRGSAGSRRSGTKARQRRYLNSARLFCPPARSAPLCPALAPPDAGRFFDSAFPNQTLGSERLPAGWQPGHWRHGGRSSRTVDLGDDPDWIRGAGLRKLSGPPERFDRIRKRSPTKQEPVKDGQVGVRSTSRGLWTANRWVSPRTGEGLKRRAICKVLP